MALVNDDGDIEVGQTMQLCVTFDHRVNDGAHAANMSRVVRECFEDPERYFGAIDEPAAAPSVDVVASA